MKCPRRFEFPLSSSMQDSEDQFVNHRCDFCGSLDPDVFMRGCEDQTILLGATDKDYKIYVSSVDPSRPLPTQKFYFQHLDTPQRERFIELYNLGHLLFDSPEGLYVTPFFAKPVKHTVH